jgi:putative transposase
MKSEVTAMHSASTFSVLKRQLDQTPIHKFIKDRNADKHCKGFDTFKHLLVMIYAQLVGACSLRELTVSLNSHHRQHYHAGLSTVNRSTLSYANCHRSVEVFNDLLQSMIHRAGRKQKREINDLVFLLDSTTINLQGPGFDEWTSLNKTRCGQGLKLHVAFEPSHALINFAAFSPTNVNDISVARGLDLQPRAIYVFDKGYCDYSWWYTIDQTGSIFVTRLKKNAAVKIVEQRPITDQVSETIEEDAIIVFSNTHLRGGKKLLYTEQLRRITVKRADKDTPLFLVTNDLNSDAVDVANLYKRRWLIELLFKWIKQNLKIRCFMGRSENAVKIQIITALIAYMLVMAWHQSMPASNSPRETLQIIKARIFQPAHFEKPPPMRRKPTQNNLLLLGLPK